MNIAKESSVLIDSAVGPLVVESRTIEGIEIDDYVHMMTLAMAVRLQIDRLVKSINPLKVKGRPPVEASDGTTIGGF
jgi:hypothetical protein